MDSHNEFLDIIRPLYFINSILCVRKYSIHNKTVFPVSLKEIAVTLSANCIFIYLFYATFQVTEFQVFSLKVYYFVIYGQHLLSFVVISCYNVGLSKIYVELIKKLQEIYCFERNQLSTKTLRRKLNVQSGFLIYMYVGVIIPKLILDPYWNWERAIFLSLTITMDLELLFIILVTGILAVKIKIWSEIAHQLAAKMNVINSNDASTTDSQVTVRDLEFLTDHNQLDIIEDYQQNDDEDSSEAKHLFVVFKQLVECTNIMKKAFQYTIFFHALTLFTQSLVHIGVLILWFKQAEYDLQVKESVLVSHSVGVILWIVKALALQALLGRAVERLHAGARAARTAACVLAACRQDLETRRYAKNALRLAASRVSHFTAVCVLPVDAALPLRLAALVTSYTVVLLQFALL